MMIKEDIDNLEKEITENSHLIKLMNNIDDTVEELINQQGLNPEVVLITISYISIMLWSNYYSSLNEEELVESFIRTKTFLTEREFASLEVYITNKKGKEFWLKMQSRIREKLINNVMVRISSIAERKH